MDRDGVEIGVLWLRCSGVAYEGKGRKGKRVVRCGYDSFPSLLCLYSHARGYISLLWFFMIHYCSYEIKRKLG